MWKSRGNRFNVVATVEAGGEEEEEEEGEEAEKDADMLIQSHPVVMIQRRDLYIKEGADLPLVFLVPRLVTRKLGWPMFPGTDAARSAIFVLVG